MWNVGVSANNDDFGNTVNIDSNGQIGFKNIEYTTNIIENNFAPGVYKAISLWSSATGNMGSITIIDGNTTEDYFYRHVMSGAKAKDHAWKNTVKLPTGYDLTSPAILQRFPSSYDTDDSIHGWSNNHIIEDVTGKWTVGAGTLERTSTTVFDTGSSSRQILLGSKNAYAQADPRLLLVEIEKVSSVIPTSITIRYKGLGGGSITAVPYFSTVPQIGLASGQGMTFDDTWRDATWSFNTSTQKVQSYWDEISVGSYYIFAWETGGQPIPREIYFDSITVNY
jgi:hypothetical protein